jgi:hypothetical protein
MWRNNGPTQLDDPDPRIRVHTKEELAELGDDREAFTRTMLRSVCELFPGTADKDVTPKERTLPFAATDKNNEFAEALCTPVPLNRYKQHNVFWIDDHGAYQFHKWLFRLAFTKSVNRFNDYYNRVNTNNTPFPKDQFMTMVRKVKARGYQRDHRRQRQTVPSSIIQVEVAEDV